MVVPDTGGWQSWQTRTTTVTLAAGVQALRVVLDTNGASGGVGNLDLLRITAGIAPPSPPASPNLALNRPATASSLESGSYPAQHVTDGRLWTRWSSSFSDPQWIAVDLGATATIERVVLRWETAYASTYQVQVSPDAQNWTTIAAIPIGDGAEDDVGGLTGTGRYIRVLATRRATPWGHSLWEIEVYGR
jgi:hypothetical protein